MKKYEILEHKADLKIRVFGRNKEELFESAMLGMTSGLRPKIKNRTSIYGSEGKEEDEVLFAYQRAKIKKIKIKSLDLEALLVDFLNEVLYLSQVNQEVYDIIKFEKFSDTELEAELIGQKAERFGEDIKAATYHGLDVQQKENKTWEATILFDI